MDLEEGYRKERSSGTSTKPAYTVEAKMQDSTPREIAAQIFDNQWRQVKYEKGLIGVPVAPMYEELILQHDMLGYAAAQALRWWLHAYNDAAGISGFSLQTRIVKHSIESSHTVTAVSAHCLVGGTEFNNSEPKDSK